MKLLLAEDDPHVGASIAQGLRLAGFAIDWVHDGRAAHGALSSQSYALLILDLKMPQLEGLDLLDMMRRQGNSIPVLVVTARDAIPDRIDGLNRGADDYMVKPFDLEELVARVNALLRRRSGPIAHEIRIGKLCVVPDTCTATVNGVELQLTAREFDLLAALMEKPGSVMSLRELEARLYGQDEEVASNAIEVLLHRLRRKLGGNWIRNVRGVGYKVIEAS